MEQNRGRDYVLRDGAVSKIYLWTATSRSRRSQTRLQRWLINTIVDSSSLFYTPQFKILLVNTNTVCHLWSPKTSAYIFGLTVANLEHRGFALLSFSLKLYLWKIKTFAAVPSEVRNLVLWFWILKYTSFDSSLLDILSVKIGDLIIFAN